MEAKMLAIREDQEEMLVKQQEFQKEMNKFLEDEYTQLPPPTLRYTEITVDITFSEKAVSGPTYINPKGNIILVLYGEGRELLYNEELFNKIKTLVINEDF
jgi:hypothetical protein